MQVGPYEVLSELGRGGMGVVYRARDPRLDREVALKLLLPLADPEERLRFQREAEAAGALRHPALLKVHEAGFERGRPYLVTALAQGSLADELRRGPLAPRRAAELVAQLAHGLELAHAQGILHRDIKPANVLLDEEGRPLLADFGLARRLQDETLTATGGVLGTPAYMAPEQARGERTDARSDVYGLGALLYACLTGSPPFQRASALLTLNAVVQEPLVPPRELAPAVPSELSRLCERFLAKAPADRPANAEALARELEAWLGGAQAKRAPGPLALTGAGIAALLLILAALGLRPAASPAPTPPPPPPAASTSDSPRPVASARRTPKAPAVDRPLAEALEAAQRVLEWDERNEAVNRLREPKELSEAIKALSERLSLAPADAADRAAAQRTLADLLTRRSARPRGLKRIYEEEASDLERALELDPGPERQAHYVRALVRLAKRSEEQGRGYEELAQWKNLCELAPQRPEGWLWQVRVLRHGKRERELLQVVEQVREVGVESRDLLLELSVVGLDFARPQLAYDACKRLLELDPADAVAWQRLAGTAQELGHEEEAFSAMERAIALREETYAYLYVGLARERLRQGQHAEALRLAKQGLERATDLDSIGRAQLEQIAEAAAQGSTGGR